MYTVITSILKEEGAGSAPPRAIRSKPIRTGKLTRCPATVASPVVRGQSREDILCRVHTTPGQTASASSWFHPQELLPSTDYRPTRPATELQEHMVNAKLTLDLMFAGTWDKACECMAY